jgi:hypothetical protein
MMAINASNPPETIEDAVRLLMFILDDQEKKVVAETAEDDLYLLGLGLGKSIRNAFGLWDRNQKLLADASSDGTPLPPDDVSCLIIRKLWTELNTPSN